MRKNASLTHTMSFCNKPCLEILGYLDKANVNASNGSIVSQRIKSCLRALLRRMFIV